MMESLRRDTLLTARQGELLQRLSATLPFLANLVPAQLYLFAPTRDERLALLSAALPSGTAPSTELAVGTTLPLQEEPLIGRTLATGKSLRGRRELDVGQPELLMLTLPIVDGTTVIAAVSLELPAENLNQPGGEQLLATARDVLWQAYSVDVAPFVYRPFAPTDGVIIADENDRIVFANDVARHIYRVLAIGSLLGRTLSDPALRRHITRETIVPQRPDERELSAGGLTLLTRRIAVRRGGDLLRTVLIVEDVTELRKREQQLRIQAAVIQEIHHRVKNNLQTIASLLRLQARRTDNGAVKAALQEGVNRILSISAAHEFLSRQPDERVNVRSLITQILDLLTPMLPPTFTLTRQFGGDDLVLSADLGTNLALVVNELLLNAIEHGFANRERGTIAVALRCDGDRSLIDLSNDGEALPAKFDATRAHSLGLQIVRTLIAGDMGGSFALTTGGDGRTHATITLPAANNV